MSILATLRAVNAAERPPATMVDLAFALDAERLAHDYAFALEAALVAALPWLAGDDAIGVHSIRAPVTDFGLILSRRARLVLRIPGERVAAARGLSGQRLSIGETSLGIGAATVRPIEAFATLRARLVATSAADEQGFIDDVAFQLDALGVKAKLICGKPLTLADARRQISGYGLALHEMSPAHSLRVQAQGLGAARRLGCGVFVHHKIIEGLDAMPE